MKKPPTLLIDGDIVAYRAATIAEKPVKWGEDLWTLHASESEAIALLESQIATLRDTLGGGNVILALTDGRSFRYDIFPDYKSNRKNTRRPMLLPVLRQHLLDHFDTYLRPRLEGDDVLGILLTHPHLVPGPRMQVSIDKDQRQIPGPLYNQNYRKVEEITPEEADEWFWVQALAGDPTDGYAGCPGIGAERGRQIIRERLAVEPYEHTLARGARRGQTEVRYREYETDSLWEVLRTRYAAAGFGEEYALTQARVARILRYTDYDFKAKQPILWSP